MSYTRTSLRILPAAHEPGYAIFNRLALRHRAPNRKDFAAQLGLGCRFGLDLSVGRNLQTVAKLTGIDEPTITRSTFQFDEENGWHFGEESFAKNRSGSSSVSFGRICPTCIADDISERDGQMDCRPHRRYWWDLLAISACPIHNVSLVGACVNCTQKFGVDTINLARCACGHNIAEQVPETIPPEYMISSQYIYGRITNKHNLDNNFLDNISLRNAIGVMAAVGIATLSRESTLEMRELKEIEKARVMTAGVKAFANWPSSYENSLDALVAEQATNKLSPRSAYSRMQTWLTMNRDIELEPIRTVIRDHAIQRIPLKKSTKLLGEKIDGDITTLGDIGRQCGCSATRVGTIAEMLGLVKAMPSHKDAVVVPTDIVAPLKTFFESTVSGRDAAKQLGLSREVFLRLVYADIVPRAFKTNGTIPARYYKTDIQKLLKQLQGSSPIVIKTPDGSTSVTRAVKICFRTTGEILSAMLEGRLCATGQLAGVAGLPGILVDISEALSILANHSQQRVYSVKEAASYLGALERTVCALKKAGWLTETRGHTTLLAQTGIDSKCLEELRNKYVTASELAKLPTVPTRPKLILRILREAGIAAVFQDTENENVQHLFPRSATENAVRRYFQLREPWRISIPPA